MPRDPQGGYTLPTGTLVKAGDTVLVSQHNPAMSDIAQALTASLSRDGRGGMLAKLPMGGNRITDLANGTSPTDAATVAQMLTATQGPPGPPDTTPFLRKVEDDGAPQVSVYDYFDRAAGVLNGTASPTGQTWNVTGTNPTSVVIDPAKGIFSTDGTNFYARYQLGFEIERAQLGLRFERTGQVRNQTIPTQFQSQRVVLILETVDSERDKMACHYQVASDTGSCQAGTPPFTGSGSAFVFPNIPLFLNPDVDYEMSVELDRATGTITVVTPTGERMTKTGVAAVMNYAATKLTVQISAVEPGQTYEMRPYVTGITVGKRLPFSPAIAGGAQPRETDLMYGSGVMSRHAMKTTRLATTGWYRIARLIQEFTVAGFRLQGQFRCEAIANNSVWTDVAFTVNHRADLPPDFSTQKRTSFGTPLGRLRVVTNSTDESYLEAYINVPTGGYVDLKALSSGYHSLYVKPSLTTSTTGYTTVEYDFPADPVLPVTFTATTNGWYRIGVASTFSSFSVAGKLKIEARAADFLSTYVEASVKSRYDFNGLPYAETIVCQQLAYEGRLKNLNQMPIGALRISAKETGPLSNDNVAIDVYLGNAAANPVTVTVYYDDAYVTPFTLPVVGATALTSASYTCWLRDDRAKREYITEALVNASFKNLTSGCPGVHNTATATIASYTFNFPNEAMNGDEIVLSTRSDITAVTITPGTGQTIVGGVTTLLAGGRATYRYDLASLTWNRVE